MGRRVSTRVLSPRDLAFATSMSAMRVRDALKLADQLRDDPHAAQRQEKLQCRPCAYITRMAGQAFTDYVCGLCGSSGSHHNTNTPKICRECAAKWDLCVCCAGDRELAEKRTTWPLATLTPKVTDAGSG